VPLGHTEQTGAPIYSEDKTDDEKHSNTNQTIPNYGPGDELMNPGEHCVQVVTPAVE
jgi:hypothetical protein